MNETVELRDTESEKKYKKFRLYKYITLTVLVAYILLGFVVFENDITLENVRYLVKNISFDVDFDNVSDESVIYYDSDTTNRFSVYKSDIVIANNSGVYLYSPNGDVTFSDTFSMSNPVIESGSRFFIIYDLGGYSFKIYNSFSLLYEETLSYTIQSASINSNGDFCINTSEKTYLSAVFVYNSNFEKIYKWLPAEKFVCDAVISSNETVFVSSIEVENGDLIAEISEIDYSNDKVKYTYSLVDELPLAMKCRNKTCTVLTDKSLLMYSKGECIASYTSKAESIEKMSIEGDYPTLAENKLLIGVNYEVKVLNDELDVVNTLNFSTQILDMKSYDDYVYILTKNKLYVIVGGDEVKTFDTDAVYSSFQVLNSNSLVLCSDDSATIYIFN